MIIKVTLIVTMNQPHKTSRRHTIHSLSNRQSRYHCIGESAHVVPRLLPRTGPRGTTVRVEEVAQHIQSCPLLLLDLLAYVPLLSVPPPLATARIDLAEEQV